MNHFWYCFKESERYADFTVNSASSFSFLNAFISKESETYTDFTVNFDSYFSLLNAWIWTLVTVSQKIRLRETTEAVVQYGCSNVAKVENFIICFIFMLYEVLFLLYMSYLCYMFYYIFITYLYVYYMFLNLFYISIFTLFDFEFMW